MPASIRRVRYFYTTVRDQPGEAYRLLSQLALEGVDLLAFNAIPMGTERTQLVLYPAEPDRLVRAAAKAGLTLGAPQHAFLITGDDRLGAFAEIHRELAAAQVNVFSSSGVTDGRGGFGYLLHVRPEEYERAAHILDRQR